MNRREPEGLGYAAYACSCIGKITSTERDSRREKSKNAPNWRLFKPFSSNFQKKAAIRYRLCQGKD